LPAPSARVDTARVRDLPSGAGAAAALAGRTRGFRRDGRRRVGDALLGPRRGARIRTPVAARRHAAQMKRALILAVFVALVVPASAFAHASVVKTHPTYRERLEGTPGTVSVLFDQGVKAFPNSIVVQTARGVIVSRTTRSAANPALMVTSLK